MNLVRTFLSEGCPVNAFDPAAIPKARGMPCHNVLSFVLSILNTVLLKVLTLSLFLTDWPQFGDLDVSRLRSSLRYPIVVDGRNMYEPSVMISRAFIRCDNFCTGTLFNLTHLKHEFRFEAEQRIPVLRQRTAKKGNGYFSGRKRTEIDCRGLAFKSYSRVSSPIGWSLDGDTRSRTSSVSLTSPRQILLSIDDPF